MSFKDNYERTKMTQGRCRFPGALFTVPLDYKNFTYIGFVGRSYDLLYDAAGEIGTRVGLATAHECHWFKNIDEMFFNRPDLLPYMDLIEMMFRLGGYDK